MIQTIKQNKKAVLAFLLALVMVIGLVTLTATEAHAMTVNASGEVAWESGDSFTLVLANKDDPTKTETHTVTYDGTNWSEIKSSILPAHAFAYTGVVNGIKYIDEQWNYDPVLWLDQHTAENLAAADVMIATGEATKDAPLNLRFNHDYAKVTFNISFNSEFVTGTDEVTALTVSGGPQDVNAFVDGNTAEVIIPPRTYEEGNLFAEVTVNDEEPLNVYVPVGGLDFKAGTHYTFDLKVGKDVVTLTPTSTDTDFPGGWTNDDSFGADWGLNDVSEIQVNGKTAWENGDKVFVHLYSEEYGHKTAVMTFENGAWKSDGEILKYLKAENPNITAVYAPDYEIKQDGSIGLKEGKLPGMAEYIPAKTTVAGKDLNISFAGVQRSYSRLRIATMPGAEITVKTTGFTPAGATEAGEHNYTLTADANGNAFLYGTFAKNATIEVTAEHKIYPEGGITEALTFNSDWQIKVGRSYAFAVKLGDRADPARANTSDIALSDGSFVSNAKIAEMTAEQKAAAVGIVFWTMYDLEFPYDDRVYPELLTDDKVMNADFPQCTHGLIVSLKNLEAMAWQSSTASVADWQEQRAEFNPSTTDYVSIAQSSTDAGFNQIYGYQLTKVLQAYNAYCEANGKTENIVKPVAALDEFSAENPAPFGSTGWYLPSVKELHMLCNEGVDDIANVSGTKNKQFLNDYFAALGKDKLLEQKYWSSTEQGGVSHTDNSIVIDFSTGIEYYTNKRVEFLIRFICAF